MNRHFIDTESGVRLCLHHVEPAEKIIGTVILAHGMFSNYRVCRGLAGHLSSLSFECWILDFQGHGFSDSPVQEPDFETTCLEDTSAVLNFVQGRNEVPIYWVGHSGGGLAILMHIARYPSQQKQLSGIVTIACQAYGAGFNWHRRLAFRFGRLLFRLIGTVPGKALKLGPENEFVRVLDQWLCWTISQAWTGSDGFDYKTRVGIIELPVLSIAANGDKVIAPVSGCEKLHNDLGSADKTFLCFGADQGYLEDYTHARVISSRNASTDVWPIVAEWLIARTCGPTDVPSQDSG